MLWLFENDDTSPFTCRFFHNIFLQTRITQTLLVIYDCCNQAQFLSKKNNHQVSCDYNFYIKFFTTVNPKEKISATLPIVTTEKPELTFSYIFSWHSSLYHISMFQSISDNWTKTFPNALISHHAFWINSKVQKYPHRGLL